MLDLIKLTYSVTVGNNFPVQFFHLACSKLGTIYLQLNKLSNPPSTIQRGFSLHSRAC